MSCDHLVRFTGHRDDAARLIGLFDVFWLASDFEGMSNSIMEAMAAGVPVVASDIPPNRELVVDGQTGFLVKVGDSVGMAQFADRILADPALADAWARGSRTDANRIQRRTDGRALTPSFIGRFWPMERRDVRNSGRRLDERARAGPRRRRVADDRRHCAPRA